MSTFTVTFVAHAFTAAEDLFEIVTTANSRVAIREVRIGQSSDFGDAQAEILPISIIRGHTAAGSGGAAGVLNPMAPWGRAADCAVNVNNTTLASGGSPATMIADIMNVAAGWNYYPPQSAYPNQLPSERECILIDVSSRAVIRIGAPADGLTLHGTLVLEELGKL